MNTISKLSKTTAVALCALALGITENALATSGANSLKVIGLTDDGRLVSFRSDKPGRSKEVGYVTGLVDNDVALVGIDFRVADGMLYGVGNGGGIYTIDPRSGVASFVNSLNDGVNPVALSGTFFGVDFNPAADRLRIVSDTGQNLSHNVNAGGTTAVQMMLNTTGPTCPPAPPPPTVLGVSGAAYTNNDNEPANPTTNTTLFGINTMSDQVVIQSPPGIGILVPTGSLGVDAGPGVGFDIYSSLVGGVSVQNRAFASLVVGGVYGFYQINPLTGKAKRVGKFNERVVDIAVRLNQ
ncbi:MAG: DUF4394 domain-containing protein [Gammaproteobacteria bacterium]